MDEVACHDKDEHGNDDQNRDEDDVQIHGRHSSSHHDFCDQNFFFSMLLQKIGIKGFTNWILNYKVNTDEQPFL